VMDSSRTCTHDMLGAVWIGISWLWVVAVEPVSHPAGQTACMQIKNSCHAGYCTW
jgi:hypothetical protein